VVIEKDGWHLIVVLRSLQLNHRHMGGKKLRWHILHAVVSTMLFGYTEIKKCEIGNTK
jgi:hypothetical protein